MTVESIYPTSARRRAMIFARKGPTRWRVDNAVQGIHSLSTLEIAVTVFQLRVVTGTPKMRSRVPR